MGEGPACISDTVSHPGVLAAQERSQGLTVPSRPPDSSRGSHLYIWKAPAGNPRFQSVPRNAEKTGELVFH